MLELIGGRYFLGIPQSTTLTNACRQAAAGADQAGRITANFPPPPLLIKEHAGKRQLTRLVGEEASTSLQRRPEMTKA
ncbi:MAG TPA: hypothetical protein VGP94_17025, partial [Tepidisphaeraceae bacterium]|nr:hypothetical protein [Tepidisphaeraceae bacterium]